MVPKRVLRQIRNQPLVLLPNISESFTREPAGTCVVSGSESTFRKVSVLFFQMITSLPSFAVKGCVSPCELHKFGFLPDVQIPLRC
jgi:hypothetical protein